MDVLKPCPFCGEAAKLDTTGRLYMVYCFSTSCYVNPATKFFRRKVEAVKAWNRRSRYERRGKWKTN